ncbi:hypothetical protein FACS18948_3120 [Clostridia bacterium]|nr:hypothetical protein FACS18948_3120 [Clostridia bacterium]
MEDKKNRVDALPQYPADKFNVQIPTDMQTSIGNLRKVTYHRVDLDTRTDDAGTPIGCDIRKERDGRYSLSKVGALKLAEAANISLISSKYVPPKTCERCKDLAKTIGEHMTCGNCEGRYNVAYSVTIRVPDLAGGFNIVTRIKEYDYCLERSRTGGASVQTPPTYRAEITEGKAFMRALCDVLNLQWTYSLEEIRKPFIVARVSLDLNHPHVQRQADRCLLSEIGALVERRRQ